MAGTALQAESTLGKMLQQNLKQIESVLPRHLTPARIARVAMMEARRAPQLMQCTPESFIGAVMESSRLGLEPGGVLGHAYLIPFRNKGRQEVQFVPGYKGLMDLARRSGMVRTFDAQMVFENDKFKYRHGTSPLLEHVPSFGERGEPIAAYAVAGLDNGEYQFAVLSLADIEKTRKRSRAGNAGPWKTDYEAMCKKTCIRALSTYLPMSNEFALAMEYDRKAEAGESQDNEMKIQADFDVGVSCPTPTRAEQVAAALSDDGNEASSAGSSDDIRGVGDPALFPNTEKPE